MHAYHILPALLAIGATIGSVSAECCGAGECVSWNPVPGKPGQPDKEVCNRWKCADGKHHGPFQCCGVSKCNVFCCNCDKSNGKVCRTPKLLSVEEPLVVDNEIVVVSDADAEMFSAANRGGTGNMTLAEFAFYFGTDSEDGDVQAKFQLYDTNEDGFLQVEEMRLE